MEVTSMLTVDLTRKRELQKLANSRGYSLRTNRKTKGTRGWEARRKRAGLEWHYPYLVSEGYVSRPCRDLDEVEKIVRAKHSIRQQAETLMKTALQRRRKSSPQCSSAQRVAH
jgi:hypothetical protein